MSRTHLFLALGRAGWGEARIGLEVARQVRARGDQAVFVVDPQLVKLFAGAGFPVHDVPPEGWGRIEPVLHEVVRRYRPSSVVLADYTMCVMSFFRRKTSPSVVAELGLPMVLIDTWHFSESGLALDASPHESLAISPAMLTYPRRLVPVPFVRPEVDGGFRLVPSVPRSSSADCVALRGQLGVPAGAPLVMVATSGWQHRRYKVAETRRLTQQLPHLLAGHVATWRSDVHVLHVGPDPFPLAPVIGDRYHWSATVPADTFRTMLTTSDLLLSLNASATTNVLATVAGTPVLTLINSHTGPVDALVDPEPHVLDWGATNLPTYRFLMWPMSMWGTLSPVLEGNPYGALLHPTEVLDARAVRETTHRLLSDDGGAAARAAYLQRVAQLPDAGQVLHGMLEAM